LFISHVFYSCLVFDWNFYHLFYPHSTFKCLMTSKIRSRIKYLMSTYNIIMHLLNSNLTQNLRLSAGFNTIYWYYSVMVYFLDYLYDKRKIRRKNWVDKFDCHDVCISMFSSIRVKYIVLLFAYFSAYTYVCSWNRDIKKRNFKWRKVLGRVMTVSKHN